jgi:hypothetical protein
MTKTIVQHEGLCHWKPMLHGDAPRPQKKNFILAVFGTWGHCRRLRWDVGGRLLVVAEMFQGDFSSVLGRFWGSFGYVCSVLTMGIDDWTV